MKKLTLILFIIFIPKIINASDITNYDIDFYLDESINREFLLSLNKSTKRICRVRSKISRRDDEILFKENIKKKLNLINEKYKSDLTTKITTQVYRNLDKNCSYKYASTFFELTEKEKKLLYENGPILNKSFVKIYFNYKKYGESYINGVYSKLDNLTLKYPDIYTDRINWFIKKRLQKTINAKKAVNSYFPYFWYDLRYFSYIKPKQNDPDCESSIAPPVCITKDFPLLYRDRDLKVYLVSGRITRSQWKIISIKGGKEREFYYGPAGHFLRDLNEEDYLYTDVEFDKNLNYLPLDYNKLPKEEKESVDLFFDFILEKKLLD